MRYIGKKDIVKNDRYLLLNPKVKQMIIFNRSSEVARARVAVLAKEYPDAVIETANRIFVDTPFASKELDDLSHSLEQGIVKESDILAFAHFVREPLIIEQKNGPASNTLFFKSVGMALFDLMVASTVNEFAQKNDLGVKVDSSMALKKDGAGNGS